MQTNMKRRTLLKSSLAGGAVGVAVAAGLLTPGQLLAAWNKAAFEAKSVDEAIAGALGASATEATAAIEIKAPDIAENGAVVPVSVASTLGGVDRIAILVEKNGTPLSSVFNLPQGTRADVSVRLKMGKTGDVIAVAQSGGKLYSARKSVKVTIGGCGG
jgi:sulfur-oxidizing protein SoxY